MNALVECTALEILDKRPELSFQETVERGNWECPPPIQRHVNHGQETNPGSTGTIVAI